MAVSGNSVAIKSFQSLAINDGLLAKVVEATKSGEKEARTSGVVKSFELFYSGFRQNISIGKLFLIPAKVCDNRKDFPIALLYGTVVREFNLGEETADLIENKFTSGEFDEYSQADYQSLKDKLFTGEDGKLTSLVIFAPNWSGIREYVGFKFTSDDTQLANLLRHLVFSAYFNPAVSSAFNALMTTVDTHKLDVTDITPKLSYPFLTENPLKEFPELTKQAGWAKPKVFLTNKTADAITKEVLDPEELNVFEALDTALTEATLPETEGMEEVADFKGPDSSNTGNAEIPEVELKSRPDYGGNNELNEANAKGASKSAAKNCTICGKPVTLYPSAVERAKRHGGAPSDYTNIFTTHAECELAKRKQDTSDLMSRKRQEGQGVTLSSKEAGIAPNRSIGENETHCIDCGAEYDVFHTCPNISPVDAGKGMRNCGRGRATFTYNRASEKAASTWLDDLKKSDPKLYAAYKIVGNQSEDSLRNMVKALSLPISMFMNTPEDEKRLAAAKYILNQKRRGKRAEAPFETPFTNVGPGTSAHDNANKAIAVEVDTLSQKGDAPIGIELDDTGLPIRASSAEHIASEIWRGVDDGGGYVAMSSKSKAANAKREDDMNKKYAGRKRADVALTEDSIWDTITEDFGEAPQVKLPGEGSGGGSGGGSGEGSGEGSGGGSGGGSKALPSAMTSETPEKAKGEADKAAKPVEKALENPETKKDEGAKSKMFQDRGKPEKKESSPEEKKSSLHKQLAEKKRLLASLLAKKATPLFKCKCGRELVTVSDKDNLYTCSGCMKPNNICDCSPSSKKSSDVTSDISEAKSKVVSPDTIDTDIKQPTKSVPEAAKVGYDSRRFTKDEDGMVVDRRDFSAGLTRFCAQCEGDLEGYRPTGTLCEECKKCPHDHVTDGYCDDCGAELSDDTNHTAAAAKVADEAQWPSKKQPEMAYPPDAAIAEKQGLSKARDLAIKLIDLDDDIIYDVAANAGQIVGNVKHMPWFVNAVAEEIAGSEEEVEKHIADIESETPSDDTWGASGWFYDTTDDEAFQDDNQRTAAAGDATDESVDMELGFGDLADLASNLPHQDHHAASSKTAAVYPVEKKNNQWYIVGLQDDKYEDGSPRPDTFIIPGMNHSLRTPEGLARGLYESLYDELQMNDNLHEGDIFDTPAGQFVCKGIHVLPYDEKAKAALAAAAANENQGDHNDYW